MLLIQLIIEREILKSWQIHFENKGIITPPDKYCYHVLMKKEFVISKDNRWLVVSDSVHA